MALKRYELSMSNLRFFVGMSNKVVLASFKGGFLNHLSYSPLFFQIPNGHGLLLIKEHVKLNVNVVLNHLAI